MFCCVGCRAVYHTLHESGLDQFYDHRQSWSSDRPQPVDDDVLDAGGLSIFDSPSFLDDHAERLDDDTLRVELHLEGVHCAGCVWLVERMPRLVDGVIEARLELTRGRMTVRWNPDAVDLSTIAEWLGGFGFQAHPLRSQNVERRDSVGKSMLIRVGICWAVAANVMLMTIALYAGLDAEADAGLYTGVLWTTFGLSAVSLVAGGTVFFRRALASFKTGRLSMDVPISLGIAVGWGHSGWATITGSGEVWFDSIVVLIAALLTARYLQIRGNGLAADAAERLVSLLPRMAHRFVDDPGGETESVPAETLDVGDHIRVRAGDVVPADGHILRGESEVSRAVLTGESRPEAVGVGEPVEAGCTNLTSPLVVAVTAVGNDTRVGRLMEWVETNTERRAPVVQLADRLSGYFIAIVLVAAIATAVAWSLIDPSRAVANVVALLVIACPCALGMATPLALTVGVGQAAGRGIHIKHDDVIEALDGVTDIVFDKTGTLTAGRPSVVDTFGDIDAALAACALESNSNHPVARALEQWARDVGDADDEPTIDALEETPGAGIRGVVDGRDIAVGRLSWFDDIDATTRQWADERARRGLTPVGVAVDGDVRAVLAVGDELRPEAQTVVDRLRRRGIDVHLLSGDHPDVVAATGAELGIDPNRITGGATPEQKLDHLQQLTDSSTDRTVAMVGDGVNDAAALRAADVGIAVDGGAEVSLVAADVFVVHDGVEPIAELLDGSHRVMHVVRRNLTGSGLYNLFGISLAAMGFITPLLAAILMPISSLAVVASSLVQKSFARSDSTRRNEARTPASTPTAPRRPATSEVPG